jgi:hypothetical protein
MIQQHRIFMLGWVAAAVGRQSPPPAAALLVHR